MPAVAPQQAGSHQAPAPVARVPFTAAAHEHVEPGPVVTATIGDSVQQMGPFDVPSYGYLRNIYLQVECTGGVTGTAVFDEDMPYSLLQQITLLDVNGAPLFGPLDGFAALQANIVGGYAFRQDPREAPSYVGTVPNPTFLLRIPVEISHYDGLGSLANQNAAAAYKLSFAINNLAGIVASGAYGTVPNVKVSVFVECWSLPNAQDLAGRPQMQLPPAHGTAQYWTSRTTDVSAGQNTVQLTRVGNLIRVITFICRDTSGDRSDSVMPDPVLFNWDARQLLNESQFYRINTGWERQANGSRDTGVFHYGFDHSVQNRAGDDTPNLWLPTVQSTRMEINGAFGAAGTVQMVVNDIAPAEIVPSERYVERSSTGFQPGLGGGSPVA